MKKDPRKVGGVYLSGYWSKKYTVIEKKGIWLTIEWEDDRTTTHCTAWDEKRDKVVSEPEGAK